MTQKEMSLGAAIMKQRRKQLQDELADMELAIKEVELRARRQAAITQMKQDFITECKIEDEYQSLLAIEREKFEKLKEEMQKEELENVGQ